jgi:hypothetical protein
VCDWNGGKAKPMGATRPNRLKEIIRRTLEFQPVTNENPILDNEVNSVIRAVSLLRQMHTNDNLTLSTCKAFIDAVVKTHSGSVPKIEHERAVSNARELSKELEFVRGKLDQQIRYTDYYREKLTAFRADIEESVSLSRKRRDDYIEAASFDATDPEKYGGLLP